MGSFPFKNTITMRPREETKEILPQAELIRLVVAMKDSSLGTNIVWERLEIGDVIIFDGNAHARDTYFKIGLIYEKTEDQIYMTPINEVRHIGAERHVDITLSRAFTCFGRGYVVNRTSNSFVHVLYKNTRRYEEKYEEKIDKSKYMLLDSMGNPKYLEKKEDVLKEVESNPTSHIYKIDKVKTQITFDEA